MAAAPLSDPQLQALLNDLPGWSAPAEEGMRRLRRRYSTPDFASALALTDRIGELAEREGHHPRLCTEWGGVTVEWWTHSAGGVTAADAAMATATDSLAAV